MRKILVLLLVLATALSFSACSPANGANNPTPSMFLSTSSEPIINWTPGPPEPLLSNDVEVMQHGIRIKLSADKQAYEQGEIINVTASIENVADHDIDYWTSSIGEPDFKLVAVSESFNILEALYAREERRYVLPMIDDKVLKPGQVITRKVTWDQKFRGKQVWPGVYRVICYFNNGLYDNEQSIPPMTGSVGVQINGNLQLLTRDQALAIAFNRPAVDKFFKTRGEKLLIRTGTQKFILITSQRSVSFGQFEKLPPDLENEVIQATLFCELSLGDDNYWHIFFSGDQGALFEVVIDAIDGSVKKDAYPDLLEKY